MALTKDSCLLFDIYVGWAQNTEARKRSNLQLHRLSVLLLAEKLRSKEASLTLQSFISSLSTNLNSKDKIFQQIFSPNLCSYKILSESKKH